MATMTIRYFGVARAAAGCAEELVALPSGATVADALELLTDRHGEKMAKVLPACSFLLDEVVVIKRDRLLPERALFDVLPPFAGG